MWSFRVPNAPCGVERNKKPVKHFAIHLFLMHRVELKVAYECDSVYLSIKFLMHRVELKVLTIPNNHIKSWVPNAPCGVERPEVEVTIRPPRGVPNAPCGVERGMERIGELLPKLFLMHRVELKAARNTLKT